MCKKYIKFSDFPIVSSSFYITKSHIHVYFNTDILYVHVYFIYKYICIHVHCIYTYILYTRIFSRTLVSRLGHRGRSVAGVWTSDQVIVAPNAVKSASLCWVLCWVRGRGVRIRGWGIFRRLWNFSTIRRRKLLIKSQIVRGKYRIKCRWTCGESHCPRLMKHSNICSSTIMIGHRDWVTCSLPPMLFKPAVYNPGNHCDEQRHANDDAHDEPRERAAVLVLVVPTTAMFTGKLVILVDAERLLGEHLCN